MNPVGLSRRVIVEAALTIIDRDGTEGLSMRRLGAELGVDPKAVYYYVPNKAALFDAVVEALYAEMALEHLPATGSWRSDLAMFATRLRDVLRRHPRAVMVFATRPGPADVYTSGAEEALARLHKAGGFPPRTALTMISCVRGLTVGLVIAEVVQPIEADTDSAVAPVGNFPTLASAITGGFDPDEQFRLGLTALLNGFATLAVTTPSG